MNRLFLFAIGLFILGCSSQDSLRTEAPPPTSDDVSAAAEPSTDVLHGLSTGSTELTSLQQPVAPEVVQADTILPAKSDSLGVVADSSESQQLYISEKLEEARQHYLAALAAEEAND